MRKRDQGQRPFASSRRVRDSLQWPIVLGESITGKVFKGLKVEIFEKFGGLRGFRG